MKAFVLKGNICYSVDPGHIAALPGGYAVCVDGCSAGAFAQLPERYAQLPVLDYGDRLILPGMVDLHIHAPQFAYRGLGMDLELMDWLSGQAFPEESKYRDPDYARQAYGIFVQGLRESATTRACVFATRHREATLELMEQLEHSGLVCRVGKVNMDRGAPEDLREESAQDSLRETETWLEQIQGRFARTAPILTPRFVPSCTDELLEGLGEIRKNWQLPVQSHLSESPGEIRFVHRLHPQNPFYGDVYRQYGLMEGGCIMAHCVWSGEEEVALLREKGVFVAHCPASNMNLSSGIAPVRKYLERGVRVGLGSDVAGGQSESIFRAMTDAIQVSKLYWRLVDQEVRPVTFPEAFYMATRAGGEFFGKVGSFEEGYAFDAVVLDDSGLPHPQQLSVAQRLERAVWLSLDLTGIRAKFVDGQPLFDRVTEG